MSEMTPNHICKNRNCTKGKDGGRKHYYACDYCDRTQNWKSAACSMECWEEYQRQVIEARSKNIEVNVLPERTDMSEDETKKLLNKSVEEVLESTKNDLKEYLDSDDVTNFNDVVEKINQEIDSKTSSAKKRRTRTKDIKNEN